MARAGTADVPQSDAARAFLDSGTEPDRVRPIVAESWLRSAAAGIDADATVAPVALESREVSAYRAEHRL
ncbi:MAG: hypothetical protein M3140_03815, partial [Actinomycetota bacterium]|nr:hypothetical protein [Actinomycetota bacterium]